MFQKMFKHIHSQKQGQKQGQKQEQEQTQGQKQEQEQNQGQRQIQEQNQGQRQIQEQKQKQGQRQIYAQIISQNQNRLPVEHKIQKRIIIPKNNFVIDLHNNINSFAELSCKKTIVHVLDNSNGFGDFLRGSIILAQYAKYFNLNFKMDVSRHFISKFLNNVVEVLSTTSKINLICFCNDNDSKNHSKLYSIIEFFINSNEENLYITTNLYYNLNLVSQDIKYCINSFFKFKQAYYDIANKLFL